MTSLRPNNEISDTGATGLVIGAIVLFIVISILWYYFMYSQYRSGQRQCSMLYPGSSLKAMREREMCKDSKRKTWSLIGAATILN